MLKMNDYTILCGYAVYLLPNIIYKAYSIPFKSVQATELVALTSACLLFHDRVVTIYNDSRYAFGVTNDEFGMSVVLRLLMVSQFTMLH